MRQWGYRQGRAAVEACGQGAEHSAGAWRGAYDTKPCHPKDLRVSATCGAPCIHMLGAWGTWWGGQSGSAVARGISEVWVCVMAL